MHRGTAVAWRVLLFLACIGACASTALGGELPDHVVARVEGRELTYDDLCIAAFERVRHRLLDKGSLATTHLRWLIERRVLEHHARRLGLRVSDTEVQEHVRAVGDDRLKELRMSREELRAAIRDQLLREHVGLQDEDPPVAFSVPLGLPGEQRAMPPGVLVEIGASDEDPLTITTLELGGELIRPGTPPDGQEVIYEKIESMLLEDAGFDLTDEAFEREIALQRRHWSAYRRLAAQAALEDVTYEDWLYAKHRMTVERMKSSRYWPGYLALVRHMRESTTAEAVRAEYERKQETHWGRYLLVTVIREEKAREGPGSVRDLRRRLAAGAAFTHVVRELNDACDPSYRAVRRRIRPSGDDLELWRRATALEAGELAGPFQTGTHVVLLRLESAYPAPSFEEIEVVVRESIARSKARAWLDSRLRDARRVQVHRRWRQAR